MYLLDTNVVINFLDASLSPVAMQKLANIVDEHCYISVITKMEALGFNFKNAGEQITMETFINGSNILNIDENTVKRTITIRKSKKIGLPDAIIAATAITLNLTLITRNTSDFTNIPGLSVIDPNQLA